MELQTFNLYWGTTHHLKLFCDFTFGTPSLVTNYRNQLAACLKLTLTWRSLHRDSVWETSVRSVTFFITIDDAHYQTGGKVRQDSNGRKKKERGWWINCLHQTYWMSWHELVNQPMAWYIQYIWSIYHINNPKEVRLVGKINSSIQFKTGLRLEYNWKNFIGWLN